MNSWLQLNIIMIYEYDKTRYQPYRKALVGRLRQEKHKTLTKLQSDEPKTCNRKGYIDCN